MAAHDTKPYYLPEEPLDLPREELELPAHATRAAHRQHVPEHHEQYTEVKTLLSWKAPGRPFKKRSKEYFMSSLLIAFLIEVILFLFSQYLLMLVVVSVVFLTFALATVPPHDFHYRISSEGITVEDHFYLWTELYDFYFKRREGIDVLHVRTHALIPGELIITLGPIEKAHIKSVLLSYLPYREVVRPTFMEKSGDWLGKNFPLERPRTHSS